MKKTLALVSRVQKEMVRDPLSLGFCLGFPIVMLVLLQTIFTYMEWVPANFAIENYAVGISVFGYTFVTLFVGMTVAEDKNREFMSRLRMAPLPKGAYCMSFVLAALPLAFVQTLLFFSVATFFGIGFSFRILLAAVYLLPSALFYILLGILIGTLAKTSQQSGPISSILISLSGMLGGVFMPVDQLGDFSKFNNLLPFIHTVKIASGVFTDDFSCFFPHAFYLLGYTLLTVLLIAGVRYLREKNS